MATDFTSHYHLDKYVATDKPNLRDQYNAAMDKIDDALYTANTNATDAKATAQQASQAVSGKASQADLDALSALLPANQFSEQSTIKAALDAKATQQDIATALQPIDTRISRLENPTRYIATIGDSFGNENTEWAALTASKTGYNLINRCTNAAGFSYAGEDGKTFIGQLQDIKNNSNFANVEYIIVYGGVNDFTMQITKENEVSAINQFMTEYNSISGTKPKLIFAFGNFGKGDVRARAAEFPTWYNYVAAECRKQGIPLVEHVPLWLACTDVRVFQSDNLHPNSIGENMIASYVQNLINGSYDGVHRRHVGSYSGNMYNITITEELASTHVAFTEILTLDNNVAHVEIKPSAMHDLFADTRFIGNTWYSMGQPVFDDNHWCTFGAADTPSDPLVSHNSDSKDGRIAIAVKTDPATGWANSTGIGSIECFNFWTRVFYWRAFGSINTLRDVFQHWDFPQAFKGEYTII